MSLSKSNIKAQDIASCGFCLVKTNINWKCIHCGFFLCSDCKTKRHIKIKNSEEHLVIDIKDLDKTETCEKIRIVDLENFRCDVHSCQKNEIFCKKCDKELCSKCLIIHNKEHRDHDEDLLAIDDLYREKENKIKNFYDKITKCLTHYQEHADKKTKRLANLRDIEEKVEQQEKNLKTLIQQKANTVRTHLKSLWESQESNYDSTQEIQDRIDKLKERESEIYKVLQSHKAKNIFTASDTMNPVLPSLTKKPSSKETFIFSESILRTIAEFSIGSLVKIPELTITDTYDSTVSDINKIRSSKCGKSFIFNKSDDTIYSATFKDSKVITNSVQKKISVVSWTMTNKEIFLLSLRNSNEVKSMAFDGKLDKFTSIDKFYTRGIHATDKNVILGFMEEGYTFPLSKDSRRGIMILDMEGRHMRTLEYDIDNQRLFSLPDVITTNTNGDICIIDYTTKAEEGRVMALSFLGQVKWVYNGHISVNQQKLNFTPCDLVTNASGLVIVADKENYTIHVLSENGDFLKSLQMPFVCQKSETLSLNINKDGHLLIGCKAWSKPTAKMCIAEIKE